MNAPWADSTYTWHFMSKRISTEHVELTWIFSLEGKHPHELANLFLQDVILASLTLRPLVLEDFIGFRLLSENEK